MAAVGRVVRDLGHGAAVLTTATVNVCRSRVPPAMVMPRRIDPRSIERAIYGFDVIAMTGRRAQFNVGRAIAGTWDRDSMPLEEHPVVRGATEHFEHGLPWHATAFYRETCEVIAAGGRRFRYRTVEQLDSRLRAFDNLFRSIESNGYGATDRSARLRFWDRVTVAVNRNGGYVFVEGVHRLSVARILHITAIPVFVTFVHASCTRASTPERFRVAP